MRLGRALYSPCSSRKNSTKMLYGLDLSTRSRIFDWREGLRKNMSKMFFTVRLLLETLVGTD